MEETENDNWADVLRLTGQALNLYTKRGEAPDWGRPNLYGPKSRRMPVWDSAAAEYLIAKDIYWGLALGEGEGCALSTFVYSRVRFALLDLRREQTQGGLTGRHDGVNRSPAAWRDPMQAAGAPVPPLMQWLPPGTYRGLPKHLARFLRYLIEREYDFDRRKGTADPLHDFAAANGVGVAAVRGWYRELVQALKGAHKPLPGVANVGESDWPLYEGSARFAGFRGKGPWIDRWGEGCGRAPWRRTEWSPEALKKNPGLALAEDRRAALEAHRRKLEPKLAAVSFDDSKWRDRPEDRQLLRDQMEGWTGADRDKSGTKVARFPRFGESLGWTRKHGTGGAGLPKHIFGPLRIGLGYTYVCRGRIPVLDMEAHRKRRRARAPVRLISLPGIF